jgi:hypothetical protein
LDHDAPSVSTARTPATTGTDRLAIVATQTTVTTRTPPATTAAVTAEYECSEEHSTEKHNGYAQEDERPEYYMRI